MSLKKVFIYGAVVGIVLAITLLSLIQIRPFSSDINGFLDIVTFRLCPFYALMFMDVFHKTGEVVFITIIMNAVIYGILGILCLCVYRLIRFLFI